MHYQEYLPAHTLRPYVQCYFTCETDTAVVTEDHVFASGCVEIMFNLGTDGPQQIVNGSQVNEPPVQLWGQTIQPFSFTSFRKHAMLGIRFHPYTAACFFAEPISVFNDQVIDFNDVAGPAARLLYEQLLTARTLKKKVQLLEAFLLQRLRHFAHKNGKLNMVSSIAQELNKDDFFENMHSVSARYGISSRYLQKLFLAYSGLTPNLFSKIIRFQKSLQLVAKNSLPLTTIAHQCGYYDQSHFIKDFKSFTGFTPSHFTPESSTDLFVPLSH